MNFIYQLSHEEYIRRVAEISPKFEVLSQYNGLKNKIHRVCKVCGDDRWVCAKSLLTGADCAACKAKERGIKHNKTQEQFLAELKEINPDIEILSQYHKYNEYVTCKCLIDGNVWQTYPSSILRGHKCPVCADKMQHRRSHEEFVEEMKERYPTIQIISKFTKVANNIKCLCNVCGHEFVTTPNHLVDSKSKGCPYCSGHGRVTEDLFIKRLAVSNENVEYLSGYYRLKSHVHVRCKLCGNEWITLAESVLSGTGCPLCRLSHGERRIEKYLQSKGLKYLSEYRFADCVNIRPLPFDFYIPSLNTCIEYDGEQHFRPVKLTGHTQEEADEKYNDLVKRDGIKTKYCEDNDIRLIRIPYTEYDEIETKLDKLLA